ncbi:MAG: hypothetical protein JWO69_714 [Thermoleophilia bacterium]|jgi:hypothetical protein|nr:hypothetical protein [Thermoleophilia bacterium]
MSKNMKILALIGGAVVLAAVVLTMFGKPPNLPLGPLQGMLAAEEEPVTGANDSAPPVDCGTGTDLGAGAGLGADPAATDPAAIDPTAGTGAVDPATGAPADPGAGAATDPAATPADTGAVTGAPADDWSGTSRVVAADGAGRSWSLVSDTPIYAADAIDPVTGLPADAAATPGATDPATGAAIDPAATDPAAIDPAATDPAAIDPCEGVAGTGTGTDPVTGLPTDPGAGAGTGTGTDPGAGAGTGTGSPAATAARSTTDGTNKGNSPEALRIAKDATGVMQQAKISVTTDATLLPAAGGAVAPGKVKPYRGKVTAAVLVIKLNDPTALQQWTGAGKKVQGQLVQNFLQRLRKSYPKASRSISVVDSAGTLLAIGDAVPRAAKGAVKTY